MMQIPIPRCINFMPTRETRNRVTFWKAIPPSALPEIARRRLAIATIARVVIN
jgi:hypothetical protein